MIDSKDCEFCDMMLWRTPSHSIRPIYLVTIIPISILEHKGPLVLEHSPVLEGVGSCANSFCQVGIAAITTNLPEDLHAIAEGCSYKSS